MTDPSRNYLPRKELRDKSYVTILVVASCLAAGVVTGMDHGIIVLGSLAAAAGAMFVIERPLVGALVLVSAVPALSGLDRGIPVPGLRLSEVLIIGVAAITLMTTKAEPWRTFDWAAFAYVLCTLGFGLFDLSNRNIGLSAENLGKLIGPLEFFLLYRTVRSLAKSPHDRRVIIKWALLASIPVSLLALMQSANIPGTRILASSYAGETDSLKVYHAHTYYRATALFAQGHLLGSYLMLIVLIAAAYLFDTKPTPLARRTMLGIVALDAVAMGTTATITPIIGVIVGVLALAYWYHRLGRALLAVMVAALCAIVIFGPTVSARINQERSGAETNGGAPSTLSFRWRVWTQEFLPTIDQHLATGYGPDLPPGSTWEFTESAYITLLLRGGLPLVLIFGWLMWIMARLSRHRDDDRRPVARSMFIVILLLVVMHTVNNYFFDSGFPQVWWGLAGVLTAGTMSQRQKTGRSALSEDVSDRPGDVTGPPRVFV
jgi:hypothetical protein